jgi:hypothetical protein
MVVQTFTLKEFQSYLNKLPSKLQKETGTINQEIAESLVRRIKFNLHEVSESSTGNLRDSIRAKLTEKNKIKIYGARYWKFLNQGKFPEAIPSQFMEQHMANPGQVGQRVNSPNFVSPTNKTNEGFVDKSIDSLNRDMDKIVNRGMQKAFQK